MAMGFTKKEVPDELSGDKAWMVCKADNFIAICKPTVYTM
jgi:hypothetical protein